MSRAWIPELLDDGCCPRILLAKLRLGVGEVDRAVAGWTGTRRRDELIAALIAAGVPSAPVRTVEELVADPEVARSGMLLDSEFPTRGAIKVAGSPIKLSEAPAPEHPRMRPPMLGEHTREVLEGIGYSAADIERLAAEGAIACA